MPLAAAAGIPVTKAGAPGVEPRGPAAF